MEKKEKSKINESANMNIICVDVFKNVLPELLIDQTTKRNIIWATNAYETHGEDCCHNEEVCSYRVLDLISKNILVPRVQKTKEQKKSRTKNRAEVFTPSWICNKMNNFCDDEWFGQKNVFNYENDDHTWIVNSDCIPFNNNMEWQDYIDSMRIEITCGEAPFLVSRYDTVTGKILDIRSRVGILDRKLRVVNENTNNEEDWLKWAYRSFEATYGYEYQGDNLLLARINLLQTFVDYYVDRFNKAPTAEMIKHIVFIISWNIWQMDGLKDIVPYKTDDDSDCQPLYCKIKDWRNNEIFEFRSLKGD